MTDVLKKQAAEAALEFIEDNCILGIGSGSTIKVFIEVLKKIKHRIDACIPSSKETEKYLRTFGFPVIDLNTTSYLQLYIDSADEVNEKREMIKGGGGALTREKVIATVADHFICIVDNSKVVEHLGHFPIAVEVLPLARSYVARELVKLGGNPVYRDGFIADNGNIILDVYNLHPNDPLNLEKTIKLITGVIDNGIFSARTADKVIVAAPVNTFIF